MPRKSLKEAGAPRRVSRSPIIARSEVRSDAQGSEIFDRIKQLAANPAVRHIAGGIATAAIAKLLSNMSTRYPQITGLLRDNLGILEHKLAEFNGSSSTDEKTFS